MTTSQQKLLPWLSNLVTKTIDQGLPVLPEVLFICRKQFRKSLFVSQGQVSQNHSPFSILFLLCCSLLCSALLSSPLLFCPLLFSALWIFRTRNAVFRTRNRVFRARKNDGHGNKPCCCGMAGLWRGFSFSSIPRIVRKIDHEWSTPGIFFGVHKLFRRVCHGELRQIRKRRCPEVRPRHTICKFICTG